MTSRDVAHVTCKGQVMIPAPLRAKYRIKPGTKVHFVEGDGEIILQPLTREYIRSVCGMLKGQGTATHELLKDRAKDKKREETKGSKLGAR